MEPKYIWMDGSLVEYEKATVHFMTPALHYGVGVFEGIAVMPPTAARQCSDYRSTWSGWSTRPRYWGFRELPYTADQLAEATKLTISANGFGGCYIRPLIYLGGEKLGLILDNGVPKVGIAAIEWPDYLGPEAMEKGVRATVSSFTRHHLNVTMTKAKIHRQLCQQRARQDRSGAAGL